MAENEKTPVDGAVKCWRRIGVWAKDEATCPKLKEFVHCANCDVYISEGRALFEQEPPSGYLAEWRSQLSVPRVSSDEEGEAILLFKLEEECLAFRASAFQSVAEPAPIHGVPHKSDALFLGLSNTGGELRLCFSLKNLLGLGGMPSKTEDGDPSRKPRFIVLERDFQSWCFPVDETLGVLRFHSKDVLNTPTTLSKANPCFVRAVLGLDGRTVGLLDDELVIFALRRALL